MIDYASPDNSGGGSPPGEQLPGGRFGDLAGVGAKGITKQMTGTLQPMDKHWKLTTSRRNRRTIQTLVVLT